MRTKTFSPSNKLSRSSNFLLSYAHLSYISGNGWNTTMIRCHVLWTHKKLKGPTINLRLKNVQYTQNPQNPNIQNLSKIKSQFKFQ